MNRPALLSAILLGLSAIPASAQNAMSEVEVRAVEIRPGVAVLFGRGGNIGVSYGADGTVLIDDQYAPLTAKIQAAVAALGASPTKFLINTHWHGDHSGGNENFGEAGAVIIAHDRVRMRLAEGGEVLGAANAPAPDAALPVVTYQDGVTLHMNGDAIEVVFLGGGHTDGDSAIYWREANVLHTGDMFMNNNGFPFIDLASGGNVEHLLNSLSRMIAMINADIVIIPGHGQLASPSDLIAFRDMVRSAVDRVAAAREQGMALELVIAANPVGDLRNSPGFVTDEAFTEAVWRSLDTHGH